MCYQPPPTAVSAGSLGGGALGFGSVDIPSLRGGGLFDGHREGTRLLDHHDVILTVLPQVELGEVKPFHTGSLQLERGGGVDRKRGEDKERKRERGERDGKR
jgi:hypothetical protein